MGKITWRWKKPARHPIFILLCGPLRSMVIPVSAGIQGEGWAPPVFIPWGAGASRHERLVRNHVPLSEQGGPAPATPARISYRGDSRSVFHTSGMREICKLKGGKVIGG